MLMRQKPRGRKLKVEKKVFIFTFFEVFLI